MSIAERFEPEIQALEEISSSEGCSPWEEERSVKGAILLNQLTAKLKAAAIMQIEFHSERGALPWGLYIFEDESVVQWSVEDGGVGVPPFTSAELKGHQESYQHGCPEVIIQRKVEGQWQPLVRPCRCFTECDIACRNGCRTEPLRSFDALVPLSWRPSN
jgi:hypothetical protein